MTSGCVTVDVPISFYRRERKKWVTYTVPVELCEGTVDELIDKLVERLAEDWAKKTGVKDDIAIMVYKEKVRRAIEQRIVSGVNRLLAKRLQEVRGEEKYILQKLSEAILAYLKVAKDKIEKPVVGMNTNRYLMFDSDTKAGPCLLQLFTLADIPYQIICPKCRRKWAMVETQRGFHLIIGLQLNPQNWRRIYSLILEERPFVCIDYKHIMMSLKRGYVTLSLGRRKAQVKRLGDRLIVRESFYHRYRRYIDQYVESENLRLELVGG